MDDTALQERLGALSLEQKVRLVTGADFWALHDEPAIGLRRVVTSDGPAGVRGERWDEREPSVNVPSPTALAATWDEARIERLGDLLAAECRRKGIDVLLAPTVNLHRTPAGGRHFECLSEDPLLTAVIAAACVRGLQRAGVGATVKHFVANDSETERFTLDAVVDERTLRELYLLPFELIVREAGPWAVMAAYNGVNGHTMTESPMLAEILKGEWGFDGLVMSDWFATRDAVGAGRSALDLAMPGPASPFASDLAGAVRDGRVPEAALDAKVAAIVRLAGRVGALDGMPAQGGTPGPWPEHEVAAELRATAAASFVLARNEGELLPLTAGALERVAVLGPNAAVARTLGGGSATVFPPYTVSPLDGLRAALGERVEVRHTPGVRAHERIPVARAEQLASVEVRFLGAGGALLAGEQRHGGALAWQGTLGPDVRTIEVRARVRAAEAGEHVIGCSGVGRYALQIRGEACFDEELALPAGADLAEAHMHPPQRGVPVALDAGEEVEVVLRHERGDAPFDALQLNVDVPHRPDDEELERAAALAGDADVAVVVVGTTEEVESEGFDRASLALPGRQDELVRRVAAANPRTVVVVNAGAPVLLPWAGDVPAVLLAWFPGQEAGSALADVLLGEREPGGRLPTTWPASEAGLPSTHPVGGTLRYDEGLLIGYRSPDRDALFAFGHGLGYTGWEYLGIEVGDRGVRVRVRNTGHRGGREVVQLYASREQSAVARPRRWLAGFGAVEAGPGEEAEVEIAVPSRALAHWDTGAQAFVVEPGGFDLTAGRSSADLRLTVRVER